MAAGRGGKRRSWGLEVFHGVVEAFGGHEGFIGLKRCARVHAGFSLGLRLLGLRRFGVVVEANSGVSVG